MRQRSTSSDSAGVVFRDHQKIENELRKLAQEALHKRENILAIYLFGSRAKGNFSAYSDADLLIVLSQDSRRQIDRLPDYLRLFIKAPLPVDVFPYTELEIQENEFARLALHEGIVLAKR